jgi:hypothetical protein
MFVVTKMPFQPRSRRGASNESMLDPADHCRKAEISIVDQVGHLFPIKMR